jgi:hypothetical protein
MVRPGRSELPAPRLGVRRTEATWGSAKPLPLILLGFCHTPNHQRPFLADASLRHAIVSGCLRREPQIDFMSAHRAKLEGFLILRFWRSPPSRAGFL